jgi:phospholipid/cholesterol/gamma-HCH transport system substrate-binding protein
MRSRLALALLAATATAIVLTVLLSGHGRAPYRLVIRLADASGIRAGSPVALGGVQAGTVSAVDLGARDRVVLHLDIDRRYAPVGRDVTAGLETTDLLGQKRVELVRGNQADPAPSGYVIPTSGVTVSTDLDQVLAVLDPGTRARLAILLNESGAALTGRGQDFNHFLAELPRDASDATTLLNQLVSGNDTLRSVLQNTNKFVSEAAARRSDIRRVVSTVGRTAGVIDTRQNELRQTLAGAPTTLLTLRRFLARLHGATMPLGPAARQIVAAAPPLVQTLDRLEAFNQAADPTLNTATAIAPELSRLALGVTPVLRAANQPLLSVTQLSTQALPTIGDTLAHSVDNLLGVVDNWGGHAISLRDGLSHIFRGEPSLTTDVVTEAIRRLLTRNGSPASRSHPGQQLQPTASSSAAGSLGAAGGPARPATKPRAGASANGPGSGQPAQPTAASQSSAPGADLGNLLTYLLGR